MAAEIDYIRRDEMENVIEMERTERRKELRRESDRIDKQRLDHEDLKEVVVGKRGDNGLSARMALMEGSVNRIERLGWIAVTVTFGALASIATAMLMR